MSHIVSRLRDNNSNSDFSAPVPTSKKGNDEFNVIKLKFMETLNNVTRAQENRDDIVSTSGRTMQVIRMELDIREGLNEMDMQINQMRDALRRQRKNPDRYPREEMDTKEKQYFNYETQARQLRAKEEGDLQEPEKPITLDDMKIRLTGGARRGEYVNRELNDSEKDAMREFKKGDDDLDVMADQVMNHLDMIKNKGLVIGDEVENQKRAIKDLEDGVNKGNDDLMVQHKKLKKINETYSAPPKWCYRGFCFIVLLVLIAVAIKLGVSEATAA